MTEICGKSTIWKSEFIVKSTSGVLKDNFLFEVKTVCYRAVW